jgi:hypothetical protein
MGYMPRTQAGASASAKRDSKLEDFLIVTPEWASEGSIQFQLGNLQFHINDDRESSKPVYCSIGGYDPKQGPQYYVPNSVTGDPTYVVDAVAIAQMDCYFPAVRVLYL